MSSVVRTAGQPGTFTYTLSVVPALPPVVTIYSDAARTVVAVPAQTLVPAGPPGAFTASYPALPAATYSLVSVTTVVVGQAPVVDADDTLILQPVQGTVGQASLLQPADVTGGELAYLLRDVDPSTLASDLAAASRTVEGMVTGRLLPFTTTTTIRTVPNPDAPRGALPLGLGYSFSLGYFARESRVGWVGEFPVWRSELWSGALVAASIVDPLQPTGLLAVDLSTADLEVETGRVQFRMPSPGLLYTSSRATRLRVTYSGGYPPGSVPEDLQRATAMVTAQQRTSMSDEENLDLMGQVADLLRPWSAEMQGGPL